MWPYCKTLSLMFGDSALPTVSLAVFLRTSLLRGKLQPSAQGPQSALASGQWVSWGPRGQAEGCVQQSSRALAMAVHWLGPDLKAAESLPYPHHFDLMVVIVSRSGSLQDPAPVWVAWGAWGPAQSWAPGSLSEDCPRVSGEPGLEICLLSQASALERRPSLCAGRSLPGRVTSLHRVPFPLARAWTSDK